jgi:hypothetical protein
MATFTLGRTKLELGLTPGYERYRYAVQRPPLTAPQHRLILISGPAATLILAAAGVAIAESDASRLLRLSCLAFAISQFGQLVESLTPRASAPFSDGSQLRHLRRYKAAFGLLSKGRVAYNRLDFVRAENLYRRALAEKTDTMLRRALTMALASTLAHLCRFNESAELTGYLATSMSADDPSLAAVRRNWADALLSAVLERGEVLEPMLVAECARWIDVPDLGEGDREEARLHGLAMLRLAQNRPAEAVPACRRSLELLSTHNGLASQWNGPRQAVSATLVVALGRSGKRAEARELVEIVEPTNPFFAAAREATGYDGHAHP